MIVMLTNKRPEVSSMEGVYGIGNVEGTWWIFLKEEARDRLKVEKVLREISFKGVPKATGTPFKNVVMETVSPYLSAPLAMKEGRLVRLEPQPIPDVFSGLYSFAEFFSLHGILEELSRGYMKLEGYKDLRTVYLKEIGKKALLGKFIISLERRARRLTSLFKILPVIPMGSFCERGLSFLRVCQINEKDRNFYQMIGNIFRNYAWKSRSVQIYLRNDVQNLNEVLCSRGVRSLTSFPWKGRDMVGYLTT